MLILIPFKPVNPKSRLSEILSDREREGLAKAMLLDVLDSLDGDVRIISTHPFNLEGYDVEVDERELDVAVNSRIEGETAVIMSDLPLINKKVVEEFFDTKGDVVIAPGRRGGTNMILIRDPRFKVSYHYCSFLKHVEIAKSLNLRVEIFDSFYASVDVDTPEDLLEILIHGRGKRSYVYLHSIGFRLKFEREPNILRM
ncbi:MAG: 2-phospho-L-lactate guanylyltransferase [Archaeoglobales archaeon]|nr:MAG: 2-phospho-L-lactate guanylyltransferase [Archaeoglobales archaeon]